MTETRFATVLNQRTHMVIEQSTARCLGGLGISFYRPWVFPLYTPAGLTVVQEAPPDHPFHNGVFVGQSPVVTGEREANFWATPPPRMHDDHLMKHIGRMDASGELTIEPHDFGVRFTMKCVWRDEHEAPILDEIRKVDLYTLEDAVFCDMTSHKISAYGPVEYPLTKHGSIGIRVEPRLLPGLGGTVIADENRRGTADVVHEQDSAYVAYENGLRDGGHFGVFMTCLNEGVVGPWFVRDYGMALYNPTWRSPITTNVGDLWSIGVRVVAYDGRLTEERAQRWQGEKARPITPVQHT